MNPQRIRWTELSADPNAVEVIRWRQEILDATRRPPVTNRVKHLRSLAEGRNVLDVGVVEHMISSQSGLRWLHRHMVEAAATCLGVDILADDVAELRNRGYDVIVHDLTESPLDRQFDLIVAGELVEHLGAPSRFFDNLRPMLAPGGRIALSTPNPYSMHRVWKTLRGEFPDSVDHSILLGPGNILELASRSGLQLDAWRGIRLKDLPGYKNRIASTARKVLRSTVMPCDLDCDSIIYELVALPD